MLNYHHISQNILQAIKNAKNILVIAHQKPDGDTLGANLALRQYLLSINKNVASFCDSPIPDYLRFLPHSHLVSDNHLLFRENFDLIITVDCASINMTGAESLLKALPNKYQLINIDHHSSNPHFGDINLVLHEACSTAEVIYRLFVDWQVNWDSDIATDLACGLVTDTGGLKNPATNYQTLNIAAELFAQGANLHQLLKIVNRGKNINQLILWGRALERLQKVEKYNLVFTWINAIDLDETNNDESAIEGIANFLHILNEGEIIMVLTEKNNTIKGSMRTTGNTDLAKIAQSLGGGGHKKAAGFSLPGHIEYVNNKIRIT